MDKKHVHYDIIEEWARTGKEVQMFETTTQKWICCDPCWNPNVQYRFKPEVIYYRRYISKSSSGVPKVSIHPNTNVDKQNFVRWIDIEWQEIEV